MLSRTDLGQVYGSVNRDLSFDDMIGDEDNLNKSDGMLSIIYIICIRINFYRHLGIEMQ